MLDIDPKDLRRKTAVQRRSRHTVATILDAAVQLLAESGEAALTTTAVAKRAGYSIGTLYQYYPNRDAILVAIAERERALIAAHMRDLVAALEVSASSELVRGFVRALIASFGRSRGARRKAALMTALTLTDMSRMLREDIAAWLAALWDKTDPAGSSRTHELRAFVATHAVWGVLHSAAVTSYPGLDEPEFEEALLCLLSAMKPQSSGVAAANFGEMPSET